MVRGQFFIGLDLGQSHDFTALAILERAVMTGEWDAAAFAHRKMAGMQLRYLERIPLGTAYPEVVERVGQVTRSAELRGRCNLVVDATGVGRPVVDLLRRAGLDCPIFPAVITGGGYGDKREWILPGAEAGPDCWAASIAATRGIADCVGDAAGAGAGGGDGGDAGEADGFGT